MHDFWKKRIPYKKEEEEKKEAVTVGILVFSSKVMTVVGPDAFGADFLAHSERVYVDHIHLSILVFLYIKHNPRFICKLPPHPPPISTSEP